jgi:hypothetical protein
MKTRRNERTPKRPGVVLADQRYFWTPEWQRAEREASADIAKGHVKSFKDATALTEDLHRKRR